MKRKFILAALIVLTIGVLNVIPAYASGSINMNYGVCSSEYTVWSDGTSLVLPSGHGNLEVSLYTNVPMNVYFYDYSGNVVWSQNRAFCSNRSFYVGSNVRSIYVKPDFSSIGSAWVAYTIK